MSLYLYAICRSGAAAPQTTGLAGEPLLMIEGGALAALAGEVSGRAVLGSAEDLLGHERVVETLMDGHDLLPVRFGTVLADEREVRALLFERAAALSAALARVAGSVELAVRAVPVRDVASERAGSETGRDYMDALRRREGLARGLEQSIGGALGPLAHSSVVARRRSSPGTVTTAHLVDRDRLEEFRERASELARELNGSAELLCTGPWPPYSFVGDER